uniref:Uncharacterized protein n=1 Tax=Emiliania huxleyi (strain CCMP1516) TaxID=280463 RepID=A0A0D3KVG7_EMIH1
MRARPGRAHKAAGGGPVQGAKVLLAAAPAARARPARAHRLLRDRRVVVRRPVARSEGSQAAAHAGGAAAGLAGRCEQLGCARQGARRLSRLAERQGAQVVPLLPRRCPLGPQEDTRGPHRGGD